LNDDDPKPDPPEALPSHVEEAVSSIAELHAGHERDATGVERLTDGSVRLVSNLKSLAVIVSLVIVWVAMPYVPNIGPHWFDPYPYPILDITLSVAAITIAVLILASQRRASRLAELREKMKLEIALLTEHKVTTLIRLIEELRRDSPQVSNRIDVEAEEMAKKSDHGAALEAIEDRAAQLAPRPAAQETMPAARPPNP
jgi:uncharacterized membrane protein